MVPIAEAAAGRGGLVVLDLSHNALADAAAGALETATALGDGRLRVDTAVALGDTAVARPSGGARRGRVGTLLSAAGEPSSE